MNTQITIIARFTQDEIGVKMNALATNEASSRELIRELSFDCLAHTLKSNNFSWANRMVAIMTPANRTAFVQFMKAMTGHKFADDVFGKKDKAATPEKLAANQAEFVEKFGGDMWKWYKEKKADKAEKESAFDEKALIRVLAAYAKDHNGEIGSDFDSMLARVKAAVIKQAQDDKALEEKTKEILAANPAMTLKQAGDKARRAMKAARDLAIANDNQPAVVAETVAA